MSCLLASRTRWTRALLSAFQRISSVRKLTHGTKPDYINQLRDSMLTPFIKNDENNALHGYNQQLSIILFSNKHNSMSQRLALELQRRGQRVKVFEITNSAEMSEIANTHTADIILAPFLTKTVPQDVYENQNVPCIIVHPGIEGDRGRHSLDWALRKKSTEWGVTLLQAAEEMDAGSIWSTSNFEIKRENINTLTKSSLYTNEVTEAAVECLLDSLTRFNQKLPPRPLDYSNVNVKGTFNEAMSKDDRTVEWTLPAEEVASQVRMSDSSPGAIATLLFTHNGKRWERNFRVFGAHLEFENHFADSRHEPGQILGQRHGAILVKCGEGALWLSHLKKKHLKLPAVSWLQDICMDIPTLQEPHLEVLEGQHPLTFQEIWTSLTPEGVCYVHFNFYNGAMNTYQCQRLSEALRRISRNERCKVVVLTGGYNFFSNGIHLNCIENAKNQSLESLQNISAINDVVRDIFTMTNKVTISAMQGNAGAGGVMMALASDLVLSRDGVVINPHYTNMKLFGSEYHTFFLEKRVTPETAKKLTSGTASMLSSEAVAIGLFDGLIGKTISEFHSEVQQIARHMASHPMLRDIILKKINTQDMAWHMEAEICRQNEMQKMMRNFQSDEYEKARKAFVYH